MDSSIRLRYAYSHLHTIIIMIEYNRPEDYKYKKYFVTNGEERRL